HDVMEARNDHLIAPLTLCCVPLVGVAAHSVQAPHPRVLEQLGGPREHSAFAGGEVFRGVEGERDQVGQVEAAWGRADHPPVVASWQRMSRVRDPREYMTSRRIIGERPLSWWSW